MSVLGATLWNYASLVNLQTLSQSRRTKPCCELELSSNERTRAEPQKNKKGQAVKQSKAVNSGSPATSHEMSWPSYLSLTAMPKGMYCDGGSPWSNTAARKERSRPVQITVHTTKGRGEGGA
jgi:hypothetical protein